MRTAMANLDVTHIHPQIIILSYCFPWLEGTVVNITQLVHDTKLIGWGKVLLSHKGCGMAKCQYKIGFSNHSVYQHPHCSHCSWQVWQFWCGGHCFGGNRAVYLYCNSSWEMKGDYPRSTCKCNFSRRYCHMQCPVVEVIISRYSRILACTCTCTAKSLLH